MLYKEVSDEHISMSSLVPKWISVSMDLHCKAIQHFKFKVCYELQGRVKMDCSYSFKQPKSLPCSVDL